MTLKKCLQFVVHGPMFGKIKNKASPYSCQGNSSYGQQTVQLPHHITVFQTTSKKVPWRDDIVCICICKGNEN